MGLYVWPVMCLMALVAGMPSRDYMPSQELVTNVPLNISDSFFCNTFGGSSCKDTPSTTSTVDIPPTDTTDKTVDIPPTDPKECECVAFYLCDNDVIIEDGRGLLDLRIKNNVCDTYDKKCCGVNNTRAETDPVQAYIPPPKPTGNPCGIRNKNGLGFRITGDVDRESQYGEFPWMVIILKIRTRNGKNQYMYQCGGSLVHPQVVLTAAHCVNGKSDLVIRVGEYDAQVKTEPFPTQDRKVREIIVHEEFNGKSLINDPALLILEDPVDMNQQNVGLICLPEVDENMDGRECVASGWGKDKFGKEGVYQNILKKTDLPIVERRTCLDALRSTVLGKNFQLHPSLICAGGEVGKDTCTGDGGSPLVCPSKEDDRVYVQAGIVAWGIGCGSKTPAAYVNVPSFIPWIQNKLALYDFSTS